MAASKAYGFPLPSSYLDTTNVQIQGEKGSPIGIRLTVALVVTSVEPTSISHLKLQLGDIIQSVNGQKIETRSQFAEIFTKISTSTPTFSMDIVILRPVTVQPVKPCQIPRGYDIVAGCKYHLGILYRIPGCRLSLSIKAYMSKIYVTKTEEGTLAALTLNIGDTILDVEGQPVSTVVDASELLYKTLKSKGFVTLVIEQPVEVVNRNIVRQALTADKSTEPTIPKDVSIICKNELKRFSSNPDLEPVKEIMKSDKKSKREVGHVTVSDKSEDVPIACDGNPNLLMPVPTPNFQLQQSQQGPPPK
uniref:PDZ domain-containing protein n=1 Tax=Panagrolaimus sp. JU765 TaxID=591449 RepID=A0AC34RK07_9BILA